MAKNPLHISIPRTAFAKTDKRWEIVRRCNGSRKAMVNFICGIGGYHGGHRGENFAIEFNVAAYDTDLSVEHLWKLVSSGDMDVGPGKDLPPEHMVQAKALFWRVHEEHEDSLWQWGVEDAYEGWKDSDMPYETFTGERVDWKFGLYGRGGKHLCIEEVEGQSLTMRDDDLEEWLNECDEGTYFRSANFIRKLFILCVQNSVELTTKAVGEEVTYRAAWRLWASFCEYALDDAISAYDTRERLSASAGLIADLIMRYGSEEGAPLVEEFKAICDIADIKIGD